MTFPEFHYKPYSVAEATGRDKKEATANALAFMDRFSKGRRKPAAERYEIFRVRALGPGMWAIYYRRRAAA